MPRIFRVVLLLMSTFTSAFTAEVKTVTIGQPLQQSRVPAWNARGLGPLPWQGVACADMTTDGRFAALGTIAPPGDPQVFLLDENGNILEQHNAGQRWINEVAVGAGGSWVAATITTPAGTVSECELLKLYAGGQELKSLESSVDAGLARSGAYFIYGAHSTNLARQLFSAGDKLAVATAGGVNWLIPSTEGRTQSAGGAASGLLTACAVNAAGDAVVGRTLRQDERNERARNLFLFTAGNRSIAWSRPVNAELEAVAPPEPGIYGPTALPYEQVQGWGPLSTAINADGKLLAAADYQGWERRFPNGDMHGFRFIPARPAIQVFDAGGQLVRRFAPEIFATPGWYDLAFTADGACLLAYPHNWTSRGLGGQPRLPADGDARRLYALHPATGAVEILVFPDAIAGVATGGNGLTAVSCWDGRVYLLDADLQSVPGVAAGVDIGAPAIVRISTDGRRILAAGADGVVRLLDAAGKLLWRTDLNTAAQPGEKPWTKNQQLGQIAPGLWQKAGQRTQSDMGNQYIIQAPEGLLLIDPNGGLSIEQNFAQIRGAGLDPMQVKYVLLTHEHGDHAPGSYLWRVITGAQVVSSPEMAYMLQHHCANSGYGFHPPQPADILIDKDQELTLAGLKITVLRLPGHTYGELGYVFTRDGKTYSATGDLIMPGGVQGATGSTDFDPRASLASLRKLAALKPDVILGGHGGGAPEDFVTKGIAIGEATGWGKMTPEKPDPLYGFTQKNYQVVAWLQPIRAAAFGDIDGDGKPDIAILTWEAKKVLLKIYLNAGGKFSATPNVMQELPGCTAGGTPKLRLVPTGAGKRADIIAVSGEQAVLLRAQEGQPTTYRAVPIPGAAQCVKFMAGDFNNDGRTDLLFGSFTNSGLNIVLQNADGAFRAGNRLDTAGLIDLQAADLNNDGKDDLVTSAGEVFLRQPDGALPATPSYRLKRAAGAGWPYIAIADFNHDGWPEVVLQTLQGNTTTLSIYPNTRDPQHPIAEEAGAVFTLPQVIENRDGPAVADWNGDGIPDLVLRSPDGLVILPGSPKGLSADTAVRVKLDYAPQYWTKPGLGDFSGRGKCDVAGWGVSQYGAWGVYIWLQP